MGRSPEASERVRAAVLGACGRMGQRLVHAILDEPRLLLTGALEIPGHVSVGEDIGVITGRGLTGVKVSQDLDDVASGADVLIDFTTPHAAMVHLRKAVELNKAIVIGTTGFSSQQWEEITTIGLRTKCVVSPNMSLGVNVVLKLLEMVCRVLGGDYDVEVIEWHHRNKVDAPSGTALRMAQVLASCLGQDLKEVGVFARHGQIGARRPGEIGVQSVRAGDIVGEHTVVFAGVGERIEIIHRAHSRDNFARGAVRAALWVVGMPQGLYDMQDVLGLKG